MHVPLGHWGQIGTVQSYHWHDRYDYNWGALEEKKKSESAREEYWQTTEGHLGELIEYYLIWAIKVEKTHSPGNLQVLI